MDKPKIHVLNANDCNASKLYARASEFERIAIEALDSGDRDVFRDLASLYLEFKVRADRAMLDELQLSVDTIDCIK
jgi:hypothetical protein